MKELSLNILDIAENSAKAEATLLAITLTEHDRHLTLTLTDDGCGMSPEVVARVTDPFYTTRTTRKVGMGLSLLKLAAEETGGTLTVTSQTREQSPTDHGTTVEATFDTGHIDFTPLGDIVSTLVTLLQGHPAMDLVFRHETDRGCVTLDTRELRDTLGPDVPLDCYEVLQWVRAYLTEQYETA